MALTFRDRLRLAIIDPGALVEQKEGSDTSDWQVDAIMEVLCPSILGTMIKNPLVIFFHTEEDRQEFIEVFKEVKPNASTLQIH